MVRISTGDLFHSCAGGGGIFRLLFQVAMPTAATGVAAAAESS
jgi:hypothetical protein